MKCRICGKEIAEKEEIHDLDTDINRVFSKPVSKRISGGTIFFCRECVHGQIENSFNADYYNDYNLLNVDRKYVEGGGQGTIKRDYYRKMIEKLKSLSPDNEKILDVGCGQGTIMLLANNIFNNVKGIDPSECECSIARGRGLNVINEFFDENFAERDYSSLVITQVLEHLQDPGLVIDMAFKTLKEGGCVYVDVPNGYRIFRDNRYYDLYAEHLNYFSLYGLSKLLTDRGFYIVSIEEVFDGNHIAAYAQKISKREKGGFELTRIKNQEILDRLYQRYNNISVWGAGVKGREFIKLSFEEKKIAHLFDMDVNLNGCYVANCDVAIEYPTKEAVNESDVIIVTAIENRESILNVLRVENAYDGRIFFIDRMDEDSSQ